MQYSDEQLNYIYDKNDGYCQYCGKKLAFINYGKVGGRGAWEVDHSNPRSRGGTDYMRNLVSACIPCNRDKSDRTGASYRTSWNRYQDASEPDTTLGEFILVGLLVYGLYRVSLSHGNSG